MLLIFSSSYAANSLWFYMYIYKVLDPYSLISITYILSRWCIHLAILKVESGALPATKSHTAKVASPDILPYWVHLFGIILVNNNFFY